MKCPRCQGTGRDISRMPIKVKVPNDRRYKLRRVWRKVGRRVGR